MVRRHTLPHSSEAGEPGVETGRRENPGRKRATPSLGADESQEELGYVYAVEHADQRLLCGQVPADAL